MENAQESSPIHTFLSQLKEYIPQNAHIKLRERLLPFTLYPASTEKFWSSENFIQVLKTSTYSLEKEKNGENIEQESDT
jgi:hypothetical protein